MKARTTKKLLSVVLTIAMLFSLGMPAMATDGEQTTAPEKVCKNLTGCVDGAHDAECDLYVAPTAPEKVCEELDGCVEGAHDAECDLYVAPTEPEKVCKNLTGCDEENNVHNEDCDLYVAPESTCKENCVLEGEHDTCMNAEEKVAADQAAEAAAKAAEEAKLIEDIKARIAALPTVEEVQAMDMAALTVLNTEITAISQEIDKLTDKSVIDTASIAAVANELNARVQTLEELEEIVYIAEVNGTQYATLQDAVDNANGGTVTLLDNATGAGVVFENGDNVVIDLNGFTYTLSESVGSSAQYGTVGFYLWGGSTVTVKNGTINMVADKMGDDDTFFKIFHSYGNLTLSDVTLDCANGVWQNGTKDEGFIAVESDNGTVSINGSTSIINCNLSPETWTVTAYKNGAITIDTTGTINGVVASYSSNASVEIKNGTFTNSNTTYAQLTSVSGGDISVSGGTFSGDVTEYLATGLKQDANGKVVIDEEKVVAKIGDKSYFSLQEAVDAAGEGDTIILQKSITGAGVVFENGDNVVIDLNGNTYTLSESVGSSAQFGTVGFYLWSGSNVTMKNGTINMIEDIDGDAYTFFKIFHSYGNLTLTDVTLDCTNGVWWNGTKDNDVGFIAVESDNGTVSINGSTSITNCNLSPETWTVTAYKNGAITIDTTGTINGVVASYGNNASVGIKNGTFTNSKLTDISSGVISVSGGTFDTSIDSEYLVTGFKQDENGKVVIDEEKVVAKIGDKSYFSLQEAVDAAGEGDTIILQKSTTGAGVVFENGDNVVIDLNGFTYTLSESVGSSAQYGTVGFYLWGGSTVTVKNGIINMIEDIDGDAYTFFKIFHSYGNLTLTNVTLDCANGVAYDGSSDVGFIAVESDNGTVFINGSTSITNCNLNLSPETWTVTAYKNGAITIDTTGTINGVVASYSSTASVEIKNGTFTDSNTKYDQLTSVNNGDISVSGGTFSEAVNADYCAEGYIPKDNDDGTYTVTNPIDTEEELIAAVAAAEDGDVIELAAEITLTKTLNVKDSIEITKGTVLGTIAVANGETLKYGMSTYTGEVTFTEGGIKLANGSTKTEEYADGTKYVYTGPITLNTDGTFEIGAGGSYDDGNTIIYGVATVGEKITLGAGGGVEVEGRKITVPYGADVDLETDKSGSKVTGFIINPLTDANGKDLATIEGIGTVYMTALGTVTLKWVDGSVVIDPANCYIDVDSDGVVDYKTDLNIDRDGNGKPDLNVDKDGNYKLDATDDNVDTDGDGKPNYKIIKGANAVWYYGNTWGLSFTANGLFEDAKYGFQYVEIDDVKLDTKHYTGKSGSTVVTLDYDYLQTLSAGTHKITVVYPDGEASANFYIREASVVPDTGDNSQIGLWIAVFGVSVVALGIAAALIIKRRKNGEA